MKLNEVLLKAADKAVEIQNPDGSFPRGNNGPWKNPDTYIRTTAHWAILLFKAYQLSSDHRYSESCYRAMDYLGSDDNRPYGYTFHCRDSKIKNRANGLIGQAWALEPFVYIGINGKNHDYLEFAREIISLHHYSDSAHLWHALEINGEDLGISHTINQQIWFTVLAYLVADGCADEELLGNCNDFLENLPGNLPFLENEKGLISHRINRSGLKMIKESILSIINLRDVDKELYRVSDGYLSFLLYGLAMLFDYSPDLKFWSNDGMKQKVTDSLEYAIRNIEELSESREDYKWAYNPAGIEIAYVIEVFKDYCGIDDYDSLVNKCLKLQFGNYYDKETALLNKNTDYPNILAARIYECVRLENHDIAIQEDSDDK